MFDCVIPTRHARNGNLFTRPAASTSNTRSYTTRFKAHRRSLPMLHVQALLKGLPAAPLHRAGAERLYPKHDTQYTSSIQDLMRKIREAIREDRFDTFRNQFKSQWKGGELDDGSGIRNGRTSDRWPRGWAASNCIPLFFCLWSSIFCSSDRNRRRRNSTKRFMESLKKGDTVVTSGGLYGKITGITDDAVTMEIAEKVRIRVLKSAVADYVKGEQA